MKRNDKRNLRTRFEPDVGFEIKPVQLRASQTTELEQLKNRLLHEVLAPVTEDGQSNLIRQAADDAASLAWGTGQPSLFFPALFEEKARLAFRQARRQYDVRRRRHDLVLEAA